MPTHRRTIAPNRARKIKVWGSVGLGAAGLALLCGIVDHNAGNGPVAYPEVTEAPSPVYPILPGNENAIPLPSATPSEKPTPTSTEVIGGLPIPSSAVISMNGLRLVYSSNYTGNREIYSKNLQTGRTENLTNNPADDANPTVSSDGSFVTFDSNRGSNGARNIYRIDMTTSEKRAERLSSGKNDSKPVYIGDKVVYVSKDSDGRGDIWAMGASGSNPQNLTAGRPKTAEDNPTALGDKVLFTSEFKPGVASSTELFRVNLDGSQPTRLTEDNVAQLDPTYSAKANSIAYVSHEDGGKGLPQVYTAPYMANTLGPSEKFTDEAAGATDPSWAFDGRALAFVAGGNIEGTLDGTTTLVLDQPPVTGAGITNEDPYLGHLTQ